MNIVSECLVNIGRESDATETYACWTPENLSGLSSSVVEIPVRRTAELAYMKEHARRLSALSSSALFRSFARALFSEKIQHESERTLPGLGGDFEPVSKVLATLCCPSDSEPVALGHTTSGTGCSCLVNVPTPTASRFGCRDTERMLARREECRIKHRNGNGFGLTFAQWFALKLWTPTASDWHGSTGKGSRRNTLAEQVAIAESRDGETVYPHPEFVEAVMMFPITWTELEGSATQSCPPSLSGSESE